MALLSQYYVPVEGESWWRAFARRLTRRRVPAFPRSVLVETRAGCNGMCVFCNYPLHRTQVPQGAMADELFQKIVEECAQHPVKRFGTYNVNEPLLDTRLEDRLALARATLRPSTRITFTTNGSRLDEARARRILDLNAVDGITVSFQSINKDAYEQTMPGLKFDETFANVNGLIELTQCHSGKRPTITVTMVTTESTEPYVQESVAYWHGKGVRARATPLENRGGSVAADSLAPHDLHAYAKCTRPFRQAVINFDGAMVLCCADYPREVVIGNVAEEAIYDLWNGKKMQAIRAALSGAKGKPPGMCQRCLIAE